MQVDLKVILHHYEELRTAYNEIKLQMWLVNAEVNLNQESTDARKALEEKENDKTATEEQLDAAQKRFKRSKTQEMDKLNNHCEALRKLADETREIAHVMEKDMIQRMHESVQPQP